MKSLQTRLEGAFYRLSDKLINKLKRKGYRDEYMDEQVRTWIARQIRVLREQRGWSQSEFAKICNKPQSTISRLEDPDYGQFSLKTLLELRSAFDCGLEVRFVEYSSAIRNSRDVSKGNMQVAEFDANQLRPTFENVFSGDVPRFVLNWSPQDRVELTAAPLEGILQESNPLVSGEEIYAEPVHHKTHIKTFGQIH